MPLLMVIALAAPVGVALALNRLRPPITTPQAPSSGSTAGAPGVGDSYFPDAGNGGYDVTQYQIAIDWDAAAQSMRSTTTFSGRATQQLDSFYYDLALRTDRVSVNDQPATFEQQGFQNVLVTPTTPLAAGTDFRVTVDYSGKPGDLRLGQVSGWWTTNAEWTAAGEPDVAAWWFPSNDHPSDPALMDVTVRVPAGMEAISVGRLESRDTGNEQDFDTWHWVARQPMATFLNFVSIGQYELREGTDGGIPYVYAVTEQLTPEQRSAAFTQLLTSTAKVRTLESMFGPYPFSEIGGVVPAHPLVFDGLENQTRPVYAARAILDPAYAPELLAHELAHMWFGDHVTVREWNDIFNSEAYAAWAQWGFIERTGGQSANAAMNDAYDRFAGRASFWRITMIDPGEDHLFDVVYQRGPMTLQALRNVIGDDAFFKLARDWNQNPSSRSLENWMATAQSETPIDLGPFFQAWIYSPRAPARTAENGFRA